MAVSRYEAERNARIQRNKERLQELNLTSLFDAFNASVRRNNPKKHRAPPTKQPRPALLEKRRSSRLANVEPVEYNEATLEKADAACARGPNFSARTEEVYTEEHVKALGDYKEAWVLFVDGYDAQGNRVYSKEDGLTCHQCRQKTLGLRTTCSSCNSLKGVFCGDCLFMRYGENVKEANANPQWTCPTCRDICNCSIHRIRRGWAPTGSLYRHAVAEGYKSVAHYVVLNNLAKPQEGAPQTLAAPQDVTQAEVLQTAKTAENVLVAGASQEEEEARTTSRPRTQQITDKLRTNKLHVASGGVTKKAAKGPKKRIENSAPIRAHGLARMTRSMA